jgi:folate-binding protein YgfZ
VDHSILLPVHRAAGARLSSGDPPEVLTYGDVPGEYRAARESCALFDQTDRGQLRIEGADASGFLHRILASDVRSMVPGEGQQSLLLSGKGKVLFAFDQFRDETGFWISTAPGTTPGLASALENYHFTEKLSIAETGQHAPMVVCGPHSDTLVRSVVVNLPGPRDHSWVRGSFRETEVVVTRSGFAGLPGLRLDVGPHGAADLWNALRLAGARPSGLVVRDSLRVEACEALYGVDVDANVYPQEARLESAFSLTKGCYVGQEVVAKIDTYGGLNKRLVVRATRRALGPNFTPLCSHSRCICSERVVAMLEAMRTERSPRIPIREIGVGPSSTPTASPRVSKPPSTCLQRSKEE